jgi:hypothetical protein
MTQMFKNTASLGMKTFKGQKQLVVDALLNSADPKTLEEIVALADKDGAYGKLINDWAQEKAGGVRGSVGYHLKELMKFGMVKEIPDTSFTSLAPTSAPPGANESFVTVTNDADMLDMARQWYGYGRWDAPYWFIGPEPGMASSTNNLKERCQAWIDLGRGELIDCKRHHLLFGEKDWHREAPPPKLQATWKQLIRLLLATRIGREPNVEGIRSYQQKHWGMKNEETCVIELCSLAAKKLTAKKGTNFDADIFAKERAKTIRDRILQYNPAFVVMYGKKDKSYWEEIAGRKFSGAPEICAVGNGPTRAVFANHPVDKFGVDPEYWLTLAGKLRHECAFNIA